MDKFKMVFNENPDSGVGNIQRAGLSATIPIGGNDPTFKNSRSRSYSRLNHDVSANSMGIIEMFRQFRITDKKNK